MTRIRFRDAAAGLGLAVLTGCANPAPAIGTGALRGEVPLAPDLGASDRAPARALPASAKPAYAAHAAPAASPDVQRAHDGHDGALTEATINTVDPARRRANVTHGPIPAIGWPPMTMDFPVAPGVDLTKTTPGGKVTLRIGKDKAGMYEIKAILPPGQAR